MKQTAYFAAVLAVGLTIALAPFPAGKGKRVISLQEDRPVPAGIADVPTNAADTSGLEVTGSIATSAKAVTETGRRLSCDEIRAMDEVELIADESYCE